VTTNVDETVCDDCGLVIDAEKIDRGPQWTVDEAGNAKDRHVGSPNTVERHDRGIGTKIGHAANGTGTMDGRMRSQVRRMRREHRRAKFDSKAERNRMKGLVEIRRMAGALGVPKSVRAQACRLFRTAQDEGLLPGRSIEAIAAGCVYAVCRMNEQPRTIAEVASVAVVSAGRIENGYAVCNRELGLPVPPMEPEAYLPRVAAAVEADRRTKRRARKLLERTESATNEGVHPGGVAAGALYLAGRRTGAHLTQDELASAADVSKATVRARFKELD
jgi:transcription initiation factor TFIIB